MTWMELFIMHIQIFPFTFSRNLYQEDNPRPLTTYKNCGCLLKDTISIEVLVIKKRRNRCCRKVKNNMWDDNKIQKCYRKRKKKSGNINQEILQNAS
jgi:hypothetical protein